MWASVYLVIALFGKQNYDRMHRIIKLGTIMKLYYSKGACSLAVHCLINELNLPCEFIAVDLGTKKTAQGQDFYTINAKGAVPSLILDDGTILTENAVIQQYLVDQAQAETLLPAVGNLQRYQILAWLNYASTDLHKSCGPLFNSKVPDELKKTIFLPILETRLAHVNQELKDRKYIFGNTLTLPDFYIFTVLRWCPHLGVKMTNYPHLQAYFDLMKTRPSVQKALQEEGLS